jgi:hypothetical protein
MVVMMLMTWLCLGSYGPWAECSVRPTPDNWRLIVFQHQRPCLVGGITVTVSSASAEIVAYIRLITNLSGYVAPLGESCA